MLSRSEASEILSAGAACGCSEALLSMGEAPWHVPGAASLLSRAGISDLVGYLLELCEMALEAGLLPHTNAGILDEDDLRMLKPYNASMGMMLESTASLPAHSASPGKRPDLRLEQIALAGRLRIPFTTGILIGIGENRADRRESLQAIADLHRAYGHIQEVIIQPLDPKPGTPMAGAQKPSLDLLIEAVRMAREVLPPEVAVQVPPNLAEPGPLLEAGADDLGGISPVTPDWINPGRAWPSPEELERSLLGFRLLERLPVYPRFVLRGWHGRRTRGLVARLAGEDGLRRSMGRKSISVRLDRYQAREEDLD